VDRAADLADTRSSQRVLQKGGIMKLTGKKALITGGNSGIGLATARLFIAEGAQVAITGRDQKTLDDAIAELGSSARGYRVDVTIAEDRKRLFAALAKDFGKLDIVFANAGISGRTPTGSTDEAIFENVIHTNLNAAFFTVNSAAPLLPQRIPLSWRSSFLLRFRRAAGASRKKLPKPCSSLRRTIPPTSTRS